MTTTPEFIRWALERRCELREIDRWRDPEQIERQLRPLRAYCEAVIEDRMFEGICVARSAVQPSNTAAGPSFPAAESAQPKGFRADEILSAYAGLDAVQAMCGPCEANALKALEAGSLAGCHGLFEVSGIEQELHRIVDINVDHCGGKTDFEERFYPTRPRWYGLWIDSPLSRKQVSLLRQLLIEVADANQALYENLQGILAALHAAWQNHLSLHVTLVPSGRVEANKWIVQAHCPRCRAGWNEDSRDCAVCGQAGPPRPARIRNVRGERPYWRLAGMLGQENVEPFLQRYRQHRLRGGNPAQSE